MKSILAIFGLLVLVLGALYLIVKNNIDGAIDGKFNSFSLNNIRGLLNPIADININFDIINSSNYSFTLKEFKVKIYDNLSGDYLAENIVKGEFLIPKGISKQDIILKDNKVVESLKSFLEKQTELLAVISFNVWGINIEFEQLLKL